MSRLAWSFSARQDLKSIRDYIAQDSKINSRRFVQRIKKSVASLSRFPESGSLLPEEGVPSLREIFVGNYRVIYHFDGSNTITIVRVIHGARLLPGNITDPSSD